jgi:hypothetical protein
VGSDYHSGDCFVGTTKHLAASGNRKALSRSVICNSGKRLVLASGSIKLDYMNTQKSIHTHSIHRLGLMLMVPLICSTALAACSDVAGRTGTHPTVSFIMAGTAATPRVQSDSDQDFYQTPTDPQFNTARDE